MASVDTQSSHQGWLTELFHELRRRRVIRAATLYAVIFWPIIQVVDILSPALSLPDSAMRLLVMAFVTGLPLVAIAAWVFELNKTGLVREGSPGTEVSGAALIGSRAELGIIGVLALVAAALFYVQLQTQAPVKASALASSPVAGTLPTSIAVLPFDSFSADERDRFFADGLTEELLNVLARVNDLQVAARTSSFAYRDVKKTVPQIGRELQVSVVLEGSVRRNDVDNTIRVTAQLINVEDGAHLWSETYDRDFNDVFKIQDDIAAAVVDQLKVTLLGGEADELRSHASASPEAMITYSMAQAELARRSEISLNDAVRLFSRATSLDENYVVAWVGLADAYSLLVSYGFGDPQTNLANAQAAVDKALSLDAESGMAWASQGLLYRQLDKNTEARTALEKAIALNPNYAMAHMWYGGLLKDADERLEAFEKALALDPRSPVAGFNVANLYVARGLDAEAMRVFNQIIEADPNFAAAYGIAGQISQKRGRLVEAIRQYAQVYDLSPSTDSAMQLAQAHLALGNFAEADEWLALSRADGMTGAQTLHYDWMVVQRHVMQDNLPAAQAAFRRLATPADESEESYLIAVYAAHLGEQPGRVVANWEAAKARFSVQASTVIDGNPVDSDLREFAMLGAAYAYQQLDQPERAAPLIAQLYEALDLQGTTTRMPQAWFRRALLDQVAGKPQLSLIGLQRAIDEGWLEYWHAEIEPILKSPMANEDMGTLVAGVENRVNLRRKQYAFEQSFGANAALFGSGTLKTGQIPQG